MNAEYLMDAIGRLDDDLVREAENYRRPKARHGWLLGWAASFAVVVLLGYGATHIGMGGGAAPDFSGGGNGGAPASGNSAPSASLGGSTGEAQGSEIPPEAAPSSPGGANSELSGASGDHGDGFSGLHGKALTISMRRDGVTCLFRSDRDRVLDKLPEGCVELGRLERLGEIEEPDVPYTDSGECVGCPVWLLMEGPETAVLYVELPKGGYLEFR